MSSPGGGESGGESSPSGDGGGGRSISSTLAMRAAAAITGFVICSILLAIVIALIVYNVYLWRRRKNEARSARRKLVRQPSPRWKAYQDANGIGSIARRGRAGPHKTTGSDNLGYAHSSGSVHVKGTGPPPTASLEDINLSDEEEERPREPRARIPKNHNNNPESFPMTNLNNNRNTTSPQFLSSNGEYPHEQGGSRGGGYHPPRPPTSRDGLIIYPNTQNYGTQDSPLEELEIQLRPAKLETSLKQASSSESPDKESLENQYIYNTFNNNNTTGPPPPYNSSPREAPSKPPRPMIQRNSGLALLSGTKNPATASLTGMGALECPGIDFGPTTISHSGGMGYNDY